MMNDREKKVLYFGVAIGILLGVIAIKTVGTRGAVIFAALAFLVPLVPELRADQAGQTAAGVRHREAAP